MVTDDELKSLYRSLRPYPSESTVSECLAELIALRERVAKAERWIAIVKHQWPSLVKMADWYAYTEEGQRAIARSPTSRQGTGDV